MSYNQVDFLKGISSVLKPLSMHFDGITWRYTVFSDKLSF